MGNKHRQQSPVPEKETFLPVNCGNDIQIIDNVADYPLGAWNIVYGTVVIDPQKYPKATYKWTVEPIKRNLNSGNLQIGIASDWNEVESKGGFCAKI